MSRYKIALIELLKNRWVPFIFCIPLFFCLHSYEGIVVDARLYLLQVIHRWHPERFVNDPPFMFGNQDSFSLFTPIYAVIIKFFGADFGSAIFCFSLQFAWIVAMLFFVKKICEKSNLQILFLPLSIILVIQTAYGMPFTNALFFHFVENYTCSRMFSLVLAIFGIVLFIDEKKYPSLILFLVGLAMHPLTAGWCIPMWMFYYYPKARMPIVLISGLFPLTFLLKWGPFDIYPKQWSMAPFSHDVTIELLVRELLGVFFFLFIVKKNTTNEFILKISRVLAITLAIGTYWTATGGVGKHILIYQFQTWRIEWLIWVFLLPFYVIILVDKISRIIRNKNIFLYDMYFLLWGFLFFIPNYEIGLATVLLAVNFQKNKLVTPIFWKRTFAVVAFYTLVLQWILEYEMENTHLFLSLFGFKIMMKNLSFLVFIVSFFIVVLLAQKVKRNGFSKKNIFTIILALLFFISPQYLVVPLIVCVLLSEKAQKPWMYVILVGLLLIDVVTNIGLRETNVFSAILPFMKRNGTVVLFPLIFLLLPIFPVICKCKFQMFLLCVVSIFIGMIAAKGYDKRSLHQKTEEQDIDTFVAQTIFPNVQDRGKIFFFVEGHLQFIPRTRFMTGAYLDDCLHVGEMLFEKQFIEATRRENLLYYKAFLDSISDKSSYHNFVTKKLSNLDTLLDRVNFLCQAKEITHLVTSVQNLSLPLLDSTSTITGQQEIYLYGCPHQVP